MDIETYNNFTNELFQNLRADERVIGLVALGSMANANRRDQYSDHDFFVVVQPSTQSFFRKNLAWLPDVDSIVLQFQETVHGLKVMYANGHLIEFAIFDLDELMVSKANDYTVLLDRADITQRMQQIARDTKSPTYNYQTEFLYFLSLLQVGVGRYWRGEKLSGHIFIKSHAMYHLLPVLTNFLPSENRQVLDNLDPFRRFEQAYPEIGEAIKAALLETPPRAAIELLQLCERQLKTVMPDYPQRAVDTLFTYLQSTTVPKKTDAQDQ